MSIQYTPAYSWIDCCLICHIYEVGALLKSCNTVISAYRYVVSTYTGDRFGAGTDARVFISLFGSKGEIEDRELESSGRDNFERGQ